MNGGNRPHARHLRLELTAHCPALQSSGYRRSIRRAPDSRSEDLLLFRCCLRRCRRPDKPCRLQARCVLGARGGSCECERARRGPSQCSGTVRFSAFLGLGGRVPGPEHLCTCPYLLGPQPFGLSPRPRSSPPASPRFCLPKSQPPVHHRKPTLPAPRPGGAGVGGRQGQSHSAEGAATTSCLLLLLHLLLVVSSPSPF